MTVIEYLSESQERHGRTSYYSLALVLLFSTKVTKPTATKGVYIQHNAITSTLPQMATHILFSSIYISIPLSCPKRHARRNLSVNHQNFQIKETSHNYLATSTNDYNSLSLSIMSGMEEKIALKILIGGLIRIERPRHKLSFYFYLFLFLFSPVRTYRRGAKWSEVKCEVYPARWQLV